MIEQFTGFGLYDKSFIQTLRDLHDPTPFLRGIVAELGPERKEIEYTQPKRRAGKTHNNWYSLFDAAMLSFTSYTKIGMRMAEFFGFFLRGGQLYPGACVPGGKADPLEYLCCGLCPDDYCCVLCGWCAADLSGIFWASTSWQ